MRKHLILLQQNKRKRGKCNRSRNLDKPQIMHSGGAHERIIRDKAFKRKWGLRFHQRKYLQEENELALITVKKSFQLKKNSQRGTNHIMRCLWKKIFIQKQFEATHISQSCKQVKSSMQRMKTKFANQGTFRDHFRFNTLVKRILYVRNVTRHLQGLTILLHHMY